MWWLAVVVGWKERKHMKTGTGYTPGPWRSLAADRSDWNESKALGMAGCIGAGGVVVAHIPQDMANAALISAAPELLEALEEMADSAEEVGARWEKRDLPGAVLDLMASLCEARAAIAKARGGVR